MSKDKPVPELTPEEAWDLLGLNKMKWNRDDPFDLDDADQRVRSVKLNDQLWAVVVRRVEPSKEGSAT